MEFIYSHTLTWLFLMFLSRIYSFIHLIRKTKESFSDKNDENPDTIIVSNIAGYVVSVLMTIVSMVFFLISVYY